MLLKTTTVVGTGESHLAFDNNRVNALAKLLELRGDLANLLFSARVARIKGEVL